MNRILVFSFIFVVFTFASNKWFDKDRLNENFKTLLKIVKKDKTLLCKDRLNLDSLEKLVKEYKSDKSLKDEIEKKATTLLYNYIDIRNNGCFKPDRFFSSDVILYPDKKEYKKILTNPILDRLEYALRKYEKIKQNGGWEKIEVKDDIYLYENKEYDVIPKIKRRLFIEGFYKGELNDSKIYSKELKEAVIEFQRHNGLKPDGVIGPLSIDALNESVDDKIKKILVNIERFRWFIDDDEYFVFVDIPGFFLEVIDKENSIFYSKVVVGRKSRPTPMMRNKISYAVLNPYWRAPKTIIKEDILPKLKKKDFDSLKAQGIVASTDIYGKEIVNFEDIEWEFFSYDDIPFYFLQKPGVHNFLGYLKLMFPNRFDVYLHDTNHKELFKYTYRALSSGCVRVRKPIELFHLLINRYKDLTYKDICDIICQGQTKEMGFAKKIPIYLLYLTTYVDKNKECYFFRDIYGYDKKMIKSIWRDNE